MGDTRSRASSLQPFPGFLRSDILANSRLYLARYYAHTEQTPPKLNAYTLPKSWRIEWQRQLGCRVLGGG